MEYLCMKHLAVGGMDYYPGDILPDGVILPKRSETLIRNGYISELKIGMKKDFDQGRLFTEKEVDAMIADAAAKAEKANEDRLTELQKDMAEQPEAFLVPSEGMIQISIKGTSGGEDEQITVVAAKAEEVQEIFSILQMNAEEGIRAIADVTSENVLILLHAADSRKTVKNAAKEQADKLFRIEAEADKSSNCEETPDSVKGVDI